MSLSWLGVGDRERDRRTGERYGACAAGNAHERPPPAVPLTVTASAAAVARPADAEVDVDAVHVRRGQAVDRRRIDTAECVQREDLHIVGVHDDVADVAREQEPAAVRRRREDLGAGRAVEAQRVDAVLTLDDVAAVAGIPDEGVVAVPGRRCRCPGCRPRCRCRPARAVGAVAAVDRVVAVAAVESALDQGRSAPPESVSLPPRPLTVSRSLAASGLVDVDLSGEDRMTCTLVATPVA